MRAAPAELIPKIPEPVRALARNAIWTYGKATARLRPLPGFLILGAQKAGTTALYAYLRRHDDVTGPLWKEVSYFDRHWSRGESWYRGNFPLRLRTRDSVVGEASPSYLFHPLAPERVRALVPDARLIAILRNPVDRAFSHYQHEVALGREPLSFEAALDREDDRMAGELDRMLADPRYFSHAWWNHTYRTRGNYAEQLERWLAVFPRDQLLVVLTDELRDATDDTYRRVLEFVGVESRSLDDYPPVFSRDYEPMPATTRARLTADYADADRRLADVLGRELPWL